MQRRFYLDLADAGLAMPIGTDLVLRAQPDAEAILLDGTRLGQVLEQAARRFDTPLALPTMDLELEKQFLLQTLGVPASVMPTFHFAGCPGDGAAAILRDGLHGPLSPRMQAMADAIGYVAANTDLVPFGMCIGPFSLMTKLLADPIVPIALAGSGITADMDTSVRAVEETLDLAISVILRYVDAQIKAGAKGIFVAEPAANAVYLSPRMIDAGSDIFDRYVMKYNLRIRALLAAWDVDLAFHCCGELTDYMVQRFASLEPSILSLGSSRKLWEDARLIADDIVMFGNLPSKRFFSDGEITAAEVQAQAGELVERMREVGQPFILGTECDVLSVPGCEAVIQTKIDAMLQVRQPSAALTR